MQKNQIVTVILEYSPRHKKAFVRGCLERGGRLPPMEPENLQNDIQVVFGIDHGLHVGISPLVIDPAARMKRQTKARKSKIP